MPRRSIRTGSVLLWIGVSTLTGGALGSEAPVEIAEPPIAESDWEHWAYRPLSRPQLPPVEDRAWARTPIDRFILAKLDAAGLASMPAADRATLLRRVTFDLTGLPPTPDEIRAFLDDASPDAYEHVVDRLLASPAYGEHFAQQWLDLARFAETDGYEHDKVRENAWRYRDWLIAALNADLPYDEFVRLQLAADELRPDDPDMQAATGFLRAGPDMPDINRQDERRHVFLNDLAGTVGSVFLGLQAGCAQCHDHKWDPLSQADFYRLRAFFDPALEFKKDKPANLVTSPETVPASFLMVRGEFHRPGPALLPGYPRIANRIGDAIPESLSTQAGGRRTALADWLTRPDHPLATRVVVNRIWQQHFGEGLSRTPSDFGLLGDEPEHLELLDWLATEFGGRKSEVRGQRPEVRGQQEETEPGRVAPLSGSVDLQWSLKRLHRLIVTSAVYRQASRPVGTVAAERWKQAHEADPENRLLSRMPRRRLTGEAIRDAMLAVSGRLNRQAGGPGVRPPLPPELENTLLKGQWPVTADAREHDRRSIYLFVRRNLRFPLFEAFDRPDMNESCPRRNRSTIAPQALVLLNSEESLEAAQGLAHHVARLTMNREEQVRLCVLRTLGRAPSNEERARLIAFVEEDAARQREEPSEPAIPADDAALVDLCLALFNLSEFVYVD